jgi:hypothetical protein
VAWAEFSGESGAHEKSTVLFDTVAIHLAYSKKYLTFETTGIAVSHEGLTQRDPLGLPVQVAIGWEDLYGFKQDLIRRLTGAPFPQAPRVELERASA